MTTKTIKLQAPIPGHNKSIEVAVLREPKGRDLMELGEPRDVSRQKDGSLKFTTNDTAVGKYLERCIEGGAEALIIVNQCTLSDMIRMREALFSFFDDATVSDAPSPSSPSISSS